MNKEYLQLNSIQHFAFCERQWALMFLEDQWLDNDLTNLGRLLHKTTDDPYFEEKRGDVLYIRGMPVISHKLRLNGILDMAEFHKDPLGCKLKKHEGVYKPIIIEYKKGKGKSDNRDIYQLVVEVMAVEEMLNCKIHYSYLYYKKTNKRQKIVISEKLRDETSALVEKMHEYYNLRKTPKAIVGKNCQLCSLKEVCLPRMTHHKKNVQNYINSFVNNEGGDNEKIT